VLGKVSAGLLMYQKRAGGVRVLLAHPGGPFFRHKDEGSWTIPKGEPEHNEELRACAVREFREEIGLPPGEPLLELGEIKQKAGKVVHAWAFEGTLPPDFLVTCNSFELEWPPRSGRWQRFPEVDKAEMFTIEEARTKINAAQAAFLDRLVALVG
jgi:predicted NUDIX family NTP pyrophosphohydrolase